MTLGEAWTSENGPLCRLGSVHFWRHLRAAGADGPVRVEARYRLAERNPDEVTLHTLHQDLQAGFGEMRTGFADLKGEMRAGFADLQVRRGRASPT